MIEHFKQFAENSSVIVLIVPGLGRMSVTPTIRVLAVPPESLMIQTTMSCLEEMAPKILLPLSEEMSSSGPGAVNFEGPEYFAMSSSTA